MKPKTNFSYATTLVAFATLVASSYAVDRIKQNNTTALNVSGSWDTLPTSSDVAVFDSTYATVGALNSGALLTWQGVRVTSPGGIVTINNSTSGQEIALGSAGIDMSAATTSLNIQRLRVDASQTWNIASGQTFNLGSSASVRVGVLSLGSGGPFTVTKTGTGSAQLNTSNTAIGNVNWDIQSGVVRAIWNGSAAWGTGTITLGGGGIATGTSFTGSVGNWTWNNAITLTNATTSFIDNQNIAGADRWLKLDSMISGSGNLEFRDTGTGFTNLDAGFIITGTNTNTGSVTIATGAEVRVGGGNAGVLDDVAGNNGKLAADSAAVINNGTLTFARLDSHTMANAISGTGNVRVGMVNLLGGSSTSTQVVTLSGNSSYSGVTTLNNGTLSVSNLANGGANSNIGASTNAASNLIFSAGSALKYTGTGQSSDRLFTYSSTVDNSGWRLESSGTGALKLTNTGSIAFAGSSNQIRTLTLDGSNSADNTLAAGLTNNGTGATNLTKVSDGKWIISGTSTYTGATTVSAGTLLVSGALGNSAVGVSNAGTVFGGSGSLAGSLTLNADTLFYVADLSDPLFVTGTVSLYSGFGVDDLAGLTWSGVNNGTYTLIDGTLGAGVFDSLAHNSLDTAYDIGGGRSAYFQQGSLQLVVIPESSTSLLGGLGLLAMLHRRRVKA
jgi:fibronectin-binding autotransporter adhesin